MEAMIVSNVILWIIVIVLALVVLALARQVGILHERVAPAGALMPTGGPKVGELTEAMSIADIHGQTVSLGGPDAANMNTLIMFISPTCPVCKSLVPTAKSLANAEKNRLQLGFRKRWRQTRTAPGIRKGSQPREIPLCTVGEARHEFRGQQVAVRGIDRRRWHAAKQRASQYAGTSRKPDRGDGYRNSHVAGNTSGAPGTITIIQ